MQTHFGNINFFFSIQTVHMHIWWVIIKKKKKGK